MVVYGLLTLSLLKLYIVCLRYVLAVVQQGLSDDLQNIYIYIYQCCQMINRD